MAGKFRVQPSYGLLAIAIFKHAQQ